MGDDARCGSSNDPAKLLTDDPVIVDEVVLGDTVLLALGSVAKVDETHRRNATRPEWDVHQVEIVFAVQALVADELRPGRFGI